MMEVPQMQYVYIRKGATLDQADAVFPITGNGMSPIIRDGDEVLVKYTDSLEPGAIGIFMIDGNPYIRQYYPTGLRSFRPDLEQVHLPDDVKYEIVGQFLCVLTPEMRPNEREEAMLKKMEEERQTQQGTADREATANVRSPKRISTPTKRKQKAAIKLDVSQLF